MEFKLEKEYKEGQKVCLSIKSLYESGLRTFLVNIVPDYVDGEMEYYDLYNDGGELACCDGEVCIIEKVESTLLTLKNDNGIKTIYFILTYEEADITLFN